MEAAVRLTATVGPSDAPEGVNRLFDGSERSGVQHLRYQLTIGLWNILPTRAFKP